MRRSALYLLPVLLLAVNGCGGSDGGGGKGGSSAGGRGGRGGSGAAGRGGTTGSAGTNGAAGTTAAAGTNGAAGTTAAAGTNGAAGTTGGSAGGAAGTTGGSAGTTGGAGGGTAGRGGAAGGAAGAAGTGAGGIAGAGVGGIGGIAGTGVGGGSGGTGGGLVLCGTNTNPDEGVTCNTVVPNGPCPTVTIGTGSPPAATGGQWVAGTYDLTSRTVYNPQDGGGDESGPRRETVVVTGSGNNFSVQMAQMSGTMLRRQGGTVVTSGTQLTFTPTCPPPGDGGDSGGTLDYSTNGSTTLTIYDMGGQGTLRLDVYTKR
jgi:hypothetical protein